MGAPIQRLWHRLLHRPFLSILQARGPAFKRRETPEDVALDDIPVTFKECEGECGPTAEELEAKERERAERFKRDQLLPIMGWSRGGPPS
ncbi:MAG TPA: hypothetical protein VFF38_02310 [Microvirga sp.]|nr:hypothetical protein [Microvirga sp.]